jgi:hypothetical protein
VLIGFLSTVELPLLDVCSWAAAFGSGFVLGGFVLAQWAAGFFLPFWLVGLAVCMGLGAAADARALRAPPSRGYACWACWRICGGNVISSLLHLRGC